MKKGKKGEMMKNVFFFIFFCGVCWNIAAQQRGGDNEAGAVEIADARNAAGAGRQWAVFIAVDTYRDSGWDQLDHPVRDARELQQILRSRYIIDNERELFNERATAEGIRSLFMNLRQEVGANDSVFVFHAGHGIKDAATEKGSWIPHDAGSNRNRKEGWISHEDIRSLLDLLPAPHVFLISDSCFSGDLLTLTRSGVSPQFDNNYYRKAYSYWSRQVMTSGASEAVPDVSEFARRLKDTLDRADGLCIDPQAIYVQVRNASPTPRLGIMPLSRNHIDGSFMFFKKEARDFMAALSINQAPAASKEPEFFIGRWTATVPYNDSFDTYVINIAPNGSCAVTMINDDAEQEASGRWSYDGTLLKISATFRNAKIAYQRNIDWVYSVRFNDENSFNYNAYTDSTKKGPLVTFRFFREG